MPGRRRGRSRFGGSARRRLEWDTVVVPPQTLASGLKAVTDMTANFHVAQRKGLTVLRMIGHLSLQPNVATQIVEVQAGISIFSAEQVAAGATPEPRTDTDISWMWWTGRPIERASAGDFWSHILVDVRSKRNFRNADDELTMLIENNGGFTLELAFNIRVLYALP